MNQACVVKQLSAAAFPPQSVQPQKLAELRQNLHPQLPKLLESLEQNGQLYLVQEYIAGKNLAMLRREQDFSAAQIASILRGVLSVLVWVHEQGWTHQNIKPENIMVRSDDSSFERSGDNLSDRIVLVDFGSAMLLPADSVSIGSPDYTAPEQLQGNASPRSDLYSLGVTCIHLLTRLSPFELFDPVHQCWHWRDFWTPEDIDATGQFQQRQIADLLDRLIALNPADRIASAAEALAALPAGRTVRLASVQPLCDWQCYATLTGHTGLFASVNAIAIDSADQQLASASDDKTVRLWDVSVETFQFALPHPQAVLAVAFHPHSPGQIVTGCRDRLVRLWDLPERKVVATLSGHTAAVTAIGFSSTHEILCSGSADKTICLWHPQTGKSLATLTGHRLAVQALALSPTASLLASASADSTTLIWNLDTMQRIAILEGHTQRLRSVAFSPNGNLLATGGEDRSIRLWEVGSWRCVRTLSGHPWSVSALAFSPDGRLLFSGSWDKTVKLWQVETGEEVASLTGHQDSVTCIAMTSTGKVIASGSQDSTIRLYQHQNAV